MQQKQLKMSPGAATLLTVMHFFKHFSSRNKNVILETSADQEAESVSNHTTT